MWNRRSYDLSRSLTVVVCGKFLEAKDGFLSELRRGLRESRQNWSESGMVQELKLSG